ncbi:uncharacterized protein LOC115980963 [Quercus lobata]|uniref:uncharacterized protein LOC115980963 n=1 Tax=Quercus lobata TaxID=97700 RepID=UPI0012458221|nr:uncharacterized protein LOC115980963 [Quercus lobata]
MAGNQTLKELATPDLNQQPLCITFPTLDAITTFELKFGLIHLLPTFHGLAGEDPQKHLKELHVEYQNMERDEEVVFGEIFLVSREANIQKEICGVRQHNGESLHEYWERFKKLCASCPHHQISAQLLIQYFYKGLLPTDRSMIDAASGGALVDKTFEVVRNLIANMAANSQQFGTRLDPPSKNVNEVNISSLEQQIVSLTFLVRQMAVRNMQIVKVCGICLVVGHPTDMCPTLQEEPIEQVNMVGGFPGQPQRKYDPYSSTCNSRWRDHPNLSYGNPQETKQFQQEVRANIQSLENQMGQMATAISRLEAQSSGKLPSQTVKFTSVEVITEVCGRISECTSHE